MSKTPVAAQAVQSKSPGPLSLLQKTWSGMRAVSGRLLLVIVVSQAVLTLVGFPLIRWGFREALRANGMYAVDTANLWIRPGFPLTVLVILLLALVIVWLLVLQFSTYLILLHYPELSWREIGHEVLRVGRKVFSPPSGMLALYLLVIVPLSGFGFTSVALNGVAIPNFITGELQKDTQGQILLLIGYLIIGYLSLRYCLTLPLFALSNEGGRASMHSSWRLTRGLRPWPILVAVAIIVLSLVIAGIALFYLMLAPTWLTDQFWRDGSPLVASASFGIAIVGMQLASGFAVALLAGVLVSYTNGTSSLIPSASTSPGKYSPSRGSLRVSIILVAVSCVGLAVATVPTMAAVSDHPDTTVLGHRGFTQGGVENTIESLEAANAAGAEMVEFDTMQTKDGQFVVMHDTDLERLTGQKLKVKDLTLDELTQMEVHADGHTGKIPSLVEYVSRANELDQQLLIELKLSGAETDTFVQDLLDVLEENDLMENHIFHTLDHGAADQLKTLNPDLTVGYIMPFAGVGIPDTMADFLVLEESSATPEMQKMVGDAGLGYFVWTPNTKETINLRLRQGVDAIITDHPDWALESRSRMDDETGLAGRLHDLMAAFVLPI